MRNRKTLVNASLSEEMCDKMGDDTMFQVGEKVTINYYPKPWDRATSFPRELTIGRAFLSEQEERCYFTTYEENNHVVAFPISEKLLLQEQIKEKIEVFQQLSIFDFFRQSI